MIRALICLLLGFLTPTARADFDITDVLNERDLVAFERLMSNFAEQLAYYRDEQIRATQEDPSLDRNQKIIQENSLRYDLDPSRVVPQVRLEIGFALVGHISQFGLPKNRRALAQMVDKAMDSLSAEYVRAEQAGDQAALYQVSVRAVALSLYDVSQAEAFQKKGTQISNQLYLGSMMFFGAAMVTGNPWVGWVGYALLGAGALVWGGQIIKVAAGRIRLVNRIDRNNAKLHNHESDFSLRLLQFIRGIEDGQHIQFTAPSSTEVFDRLSSIFCSMQWRAPKL